MRMNHSGRDALLMLAVLLISMLACGKDQTAQTELRVEIGIEQRVVKNNEEISVLTTVRNGGVAEQSVGIWSCSYPQQWISDNPVVHIKSVPCKKNDVVQMKLKPGQTYERKLLVGVTLPGKHSSQSEVHFRLGFHSADAEEKPATPIWSNAVAISVTE